MQSVSSYHNFISKIVVSLIVVLTVASIANVYEQTTNYHHGLQVLFIAVGFAASFSVTVYIVMIAQTKATKVVAVVFALVFGYVSGQIQTELYIASGATFSVALAYGFGVPGFEAALAILEAMLNMEAIKTKTKTLVDELNERIGVLASEQQRLTGENASLNERLEQQAVNAERLRNEQTAKPQTNVAAEQPNEQAKERRKQVVVAYKQNPNASYQEVANGLGVNKSVVWNDVKWLAQNEIVHVSTVGRKTTVIVNGNEPQFMVS